MSRVIKMVTVACLAFVIFAPMALARGFRGRLLRRRILRSRLGLGMGLGYVPLLLWDGLLRRSLGRGPTQDA